MTDYGINWDIYKKYTNPFEYIHSVIPHKRTGVSKYKPLSRSYFKMVELIDEFQFGLDSPTPIRSFHLAEGPGGFIEAVVNTRKTVLSNGENNDMYVGMTLAETAPLIAVTPGATKPDPPPGWKKSRSFLDENHNVSIEKGADKTGNILSLSNLVSVNEKYGNTMDFITADGGFDFSADFSHQEINITQLLFGQIVFALCLQKTGGSFVLKIFDCFMKHTVEILALLSSVYEEVYITKPHTSRSANSEKYVVCKRFHHSSVQLYPYLFFAFKEILEKPDDHGFIGGIFSVPIPHYFLQKVEKYNGIVGEKQLENIEKTMKLMDDVKMTEQRTKDVYIHNRTRKLSHTGGAGGVQFTAHLPPIRSFHSNAEIDILISSNVMKCVHWCVKHNIPI
jgi:23S rRNA U2552 (ribose-2'-O)-methylase RlmE/FtsJ